MYCGFTFLTQLPSVWLSLPVFATLIWENECVMWQKSMRKCKGASPQGSRTGTQLASGRKKDWTLSRHIHNRESESGTHNFRSVQMNPYWWPNERFQILGLGVSLWLVRTYPRHQIVTLVPARPMYGGFTILTKLPRVRLSLFPTLIWRNACHSTNKIYR